MKKLLTLTITAILCFGLISSAFAALDTDTVWEVRTTGNDNNGGGFNSTNASAGTDYSQQDAAQLALTDLAMTTGGTTLTSATGGFTEAMEGNIIQIVSGTNFTAGFYEIVTYTDTNTVTIDRDATDGSNASSGVGNVGGALLTLEQADTAAIASNTVYVKAGTYTETLDTDQACKWIGYNTTRSDAPIGADRPVVDGENTRSNCIVLDQSGTRIENFIAKRGTGVGISVGGSFNAWYTILNVRSTANGSAGISIAADKTCFIFGSESDSNSGDGFYSTYGGTKYLGYLYFHDNTGDGADLHGNTTLAQAFALVFDTNNGDGYSGDARHMHCVSYNNGIEGFDFIVTSIMDCVNNVSKDNTSNGFSNGSSLDKDNYVFNYNCYNGNGTALVNFTAGDNDVTSDPLFTNAAAGDFTYQSGSPCLDAGMQPGTYTGLTGDYKWNIGVDQDDNTAGGSSEHSYGFVN